MLNPEVGGQIATARSPGFRKWILPAAALILAGLAAGIFIGKGRRPNTAAAFRRLTYRRGTIYTARFTPDGQSIVYDAAWGGNPAELFATRRDTPEGRSLGLSQTTLLSLSSRGEMAVLTHSAYVHLSVNVGTLARAPLAGGAPREMTELVNEADWAPDGSRLLVVRRTGGKDVLEYPPGKVLVETGGWISHARFSPRGDRIAYLNHPVPGDNLGSVMMVDLAGKKTILSAGWSAVVGLAWSPDGREICFTAAHWGSALSLHAVTRSGKERLMLASPGGDLLLGRQDSRYVALVAAPGDSRERDLSWLSATAPVDLSPDGRTVLLTEWGLGNGYAVGLRRTDGSPIVCLGDGNALALSRDGKFALTLSAAAPQYLTVVPTGAGDSRRLDVEGMTSYLREGASWFPDDKRILFAGAEPGHKMRTYWLDVAGGQPHPITPEGITGTSLFPDGRFVAAAGADDKDALYPVAGGDPVVVRGAKEGDLPVQWTADGRALYLQERGDWPKRVFRLDLATGRRELWKEIAPSDHAGLVPSNGRIRFTPNGNAYAYGARYVLSQLYLAEGLK